MLRKRCVIWETCLLVFGVLFAFYLMGCNHRIDSGEVNEAENEKQKMKEKKINFNRKFEFIFLKKIVKKLTAFFGNFKEKETNSLQKQSFVLN